MADRTNTDPVPQEVAEIPHDAVHRAAKAMYLSRPRHPYAEWDLEPFTVREAIRGEARAALRASGHLDMLEALRNFTDGREISYPQALECARAAIAKAEGHSDG